MISQILKKKIKRDYGKILDPLLISTIDLKSLDKKLEEEGNKDEGFKAAVKETRRSQKAKNASNKHSNKLRNELASLEIDVRRAIFERDALKAEIEEIQKDILKYKYW